MTEKLKHILNDPRWWLGAGSALLMSSLFLAAARQISGWEESSLRFFYNLPSFLTPVLLGLTFLGSVWTLAAVVIFYLWRQKRLLALELGLAAAVAYGLTVALKQLVARPRPAELLPDIMSREIFLDLKLGFPSGHAALSTALALLVMPFLPGRWRLLAPVWIILVGISRLHLGVHAPLDVIGGIGIGLAAAGFIRLMMPRLNQAAPKG